MIGIIQGRLSPPIEGFQETPKNWKAEDIGYTAYRVGPNELGQSAI